MQEIGSFLRTPAAGHKVKRALAHFPQLSLHCTVSPITRTVLRIVTAVTPQFEWREQVHGQARHLLSLAVHHAVSMLHPALLRVFLPTASPRMLL